MKDIRIITIHTSELTEDGRCSGCNKQLRPATGKSTAGYTKAFRDGYDRINWDEVGEAIRKAQDKAKKAYLN